MEIHQPIFIVGAGRSGSTLLYYLMAGHKDLSWFSNYTNMFRNQPWLSKFNYLYKNPLVSKYLRDNQFFPFVTPSEGHNHWDYFHPLEPLGDPPLFESDVKYSNIPLMKSTILKHLKYSRCARFLNKNTRNTRRSRYLSKIFPDAFFIHIIRDGRAVTDSLLRVHFWKNLPLWFLDDFKNPTQLISEGKNEVLLAAHLWKYEVERMLSDSNKISKNQYYEIKYEELTKEPFSTLKNILNFCNLDYYQNFEKHIKSFNIVNMNYKWKQNLTEKNILLIEKELGVLLKRLGY